MSTDDNILMISDLNKVQYFRDSLKESQEDLLKRLDSISIEDAELYHNSIMVVKTTVTSDIADVAILNLSLSQTRKASNFITELLKCQKEKNMKITNEKDNVQKELNSVLDRIDRLIVDILKCKETLDNISQLFTQRSSAKDTSEE